MQPISVQSSNVQAVQYSPAALTLTVWFQSGGVYEYHGVAEHLYQQFLAAQPHPWTAVGRAIKLHRFVKLA
ncbi:KTSC domain-containing protein [Pseudarthrobacter sp. NBSH8]|uniref:KTSC domain-containing protein n=1 Tax=Pseudarthrobacter sp. NBSH8 TaxID=2596911 RepID=UPI001629FA72|nr:KTSC domain-containing protein [Pseudarthrobacter sp. NBSH8]